MRILWFAYLRSVTGEGSETVDPPATIKTVFELVPWLKSQSARYSAALADMSMVRVAVNQEYAYPDHPVSASDEIAFFPPVTGG
jgi:molybdopterin synthase sulfur carrier subunit